MTFLEDWIAVALFVAWGIWALVGAWFYRRDCEYEEQFDWLLFDDEDGEDSDDAD